MSRILNLTCAALAACGLGAATTAAPASAANPPKMSDLMRDYDLRLSVSMRSKFAFQPNPTGCNGRKPSGYAGSGEEILEMESPKPVRVTMVTAPGAQPAITRKDLKAGFELAGASRRSGDMTHVVCDDTFPNEAQGCTGRFPVNQKVYLSFFRGSWLVGTQAGPTTRDLVKSCTDAQFDWDGAVARTGVILLEQAKGRAARSKLKARSFTLEARLTEDCEVEYFGTGSCRTEWIYKANFRQVRTKGRG